MSNALKLGGRISALVLAAGVAAGCSTVTKEQLAEVRSTANTALSEARAAQSAANNAQNVASEAAEAARRAQRTADAAQTCCNENSQKIENMFEKVMRK